MGKTQGSVSHIGDGAPAIVLQEIQQSWPGISITFRTDDISRPTDWRIRNKQHSIIVHLGGRMSHLETELEGTGGSYGTALPGEVWTAPAGKTYASHACGEMIRYGLIALDPGSARDLPTRSLDVDQPIAALAGQRDDFLHQALRQLEFASANQDDLSLMLSQSLAETIRLHLWKTYSEGGSAKMRQTSKALGMDPVTTRKLKEYIHDHLSDRLSLNAMANLAGLTTHQFLARFRQMFGSSPMQYVIQKRLQHAQHLLLTTRKDITTIALDSGFSSHSHLTSCFRQHLGCSPSLFRVGSEP